jgi:hypothetical protein
MLMTNVDHFPSSPSNAPLGLSTTGFGGSCIGAASALFWEGMAYSEVWTIQTAIDLGSDALHGQVLSASIQFLVQLDRKIVEKAGTFKGRSSTTTEVRVCFGLRTSWDLW